MLTEKNYEGKLNIASVTLTKFTNFNRLRAITISNHLAFGWNPVH